MTDDLQAMIARDILARAQRLGAHVTDFRNTIIPRQDDPGSQIGFCATVGAIKAGHLPVSIEWTPHRSQGRRRDWTRMEAAIGRDGVPLPRLELRLDERLRDIARLQRREEAVRSVRDDHFYPAWSFTIHAAIAGLLHHHGVDPATLTRVGKRDFPLDQWEIARMNLGIQTSPRHHEGDPRQPSMQAAMCGSRLMFRSLAFPSLDITIEEIAGRITLYLGQREMPETARLALRGRNVADVVAHPGLSGSDDVIITGVNRHAKTNAIGLKLSDTRIPVAHAPGGVDVSWLRD